MNTQTKSPLIRAMVEQITNNATSWIGHPSNENRNVIGGQTFTAPSEAELAGIEVFTSMVSRPGSVLLTLHNVDPQLKSWGPVLGSANVDFNRGDNGKWKTFNISGLHLNKGKTYGFRLESPNCYLGVGEKVASNETLLPVDGQEWMFINKDQTGQSFSYFSLAFKVDVRA